MKYRNIRVSKSIRKSWRGNVTLVAVLRNVYTILVGQLGMKLGEDFRIILKPFLQKRGVIVCELGLFSSE
jgi:hypothetical protein